VSVVRSGRAGKTYRPGMADTHAGGLFLFHPTLTIDEARALTTLGAIYAFGVPDLDAARREVSEPAEEHCTCWWAQKEGLRS
jgi:hypothetical protein